MRALTVQALLAALAGEDPSTLVAVEGCDCAALAVGARVHDGVFYVCRYAHGPSYLVPREDLEEALAHGDSARDASA